jgi:hypothetical protein
MFECIINCIICSEYDLNISILEKICKFSYHWALLREINPVVVVLLCEGGRDVFRIICVLNFEIIE